MPVMLAQLPETDPLRNTPMRDIGVECRNKLSGEKGWRRIEKWKIGSFCYNQLGVVWTELSDFRAEATCP